MDIPGQLKCFVDRLGCSLYSYFGMKIPKNYKVIGAIAQGCHLSSGQEQSITTLVNHALLMSCIPISGDHWESYTGGMGCTKLEGDKDALKKLFKEGEFEGVAAVRSAQSLGKRVAEVTLILKDGITTRKEKLDKDPLCEPLMKRIKMR